MDFLGSGEILIGSSQKGEQTIPFTAGCLTIPQRLQKMLSPTPHGEGGGQPTGAQLVA